MAANDIRISVRTAGVNRADLLQAAGKYPPPPGAPDILGLECAGTNVETGQRVMALLAGGGYAREVIADAGSVMRVPDVLSDEEAGGFPEVFLTAYLNVFELARAKQGETLLIHGGGSGVGTAATTLAKLAGMRVVVTAGSEEKCRRCLEHGADQAINYSTADFAERLRDVDIVLDHIGASYLRRNLQVLGTGGRLVNIGSMGGERRAELDLSSLLAKRQQIIGSTLRSRPPEEKALLVRGFLARFGADLEAGRIRPVVYRVFPIDRVKEAHRLMQSSEHFGKIVLRVS